MTAARRLQLIPIEEYLAGELASPVKHEYLGGVVYAMAGGSYSHTLIASNILGALHAQLRGRKCRALNFDAKIRVRLAHQTRFYYPDALVVCEPGDPRARFQDHPVVVVEVLSRSTLRTDTGEKKDAYLSLPTVAAYLLVEQESAAIVVMRRTDSGFVREVYEGMTSVIPLPEIDANLALADVYETVEFVPELESDDSLADPSAESPR